MRSIAVLALAVVSAGSYAVELWNNGPIETGAIHSTGAIAPGGGQWSELQMVGTATSNTLGFSFANNPFRLADDFTVSGGNWHITSFTFYGYTTGATAPTATAGFLQIWNGDPSAGGTVIFGDTTTNIMSSVVFSDIYRTGRASGGTTRRQQLVTLGLSLNLAPGTYWADFATTGLNFSPPVTPIGQLGKAGANGKQWTGSWASMTDTGTGVAQDANFKINGTVVPEPATLAVLGLGAAFLLRRRK